MIRQDLGLDKILADVVLEMNADDSANASDWLMGSAYIFGDKYIKTCFVFINTLQLRGKLVEQIKSETKDFIIKMYNRFGKV